MGSLIRNCNGLLASPLAKILPRLLPLSAPFSTKAIEHVDSPHPQQIITSVNKAIDNAGRLFAVVQVCGKQFKVTDNDLIVVEGSWPPNIGDEIRLEKVLLAGAADFTLIGRPILPLNQIFVKATVVEKPLAHTKVTFRYMKRKQYRNINFLKLPQTYLRINSIKLLGKVNCLGTPGTGKSRLAKTVAERLNFRWLDVGAEAKKRGCCEERDEERNADILDEDLTVAALEKDAASGAVVFDYHGVDFFPANWFDGIFVLQTDNTVLYDRLAARGYPQKKIVENVAAEIFQEILTEARDAFDDDKVFPLKSDTEGDFLDNVKFITDFVKTWTLESDGSSSD